jgi:predicted DCC family thiol-disulfide oxidoreductase YuxK
MWVSLNVRLNFTTISNMESPAIILFDGVCNFCNGAVKFVLLRDKKNAIKFAALQSEIGQALLKQHGISADRFDSFVFLEQGRLYTRSSAALRVCKYLRGLWPLLYGFIIVPAFARDAMYDWIAKNRYRWFGKQDKCMVPSPGTRERFL